jgi:hypothetical protein
MDRRLGGAQFPAVSAARGEACVMGLLACWPSGLLAFWPIMRVEDCLQWDNRDEHGTKLKGQKATRPQGP